MSLSNSEYDKITDIYAERRFRAQRERDERAEAVLKSVPVIADYDDEIRQASIDMAMKSLDGDDEGAAKAKERLDSLIEERRALLVSEGFAADETDVRYTCPECLDTGFVDGRRCECMKKELAAAYLARTGLAEVFGKENFGTFTDAYYSDDKLANGSTVKQHMRAVKDLCEEYVRNFDNSRADMIFCGHAGVGKTFFARCIAGALLERGVDVVYVNAAELAEILNASLFYDRREEVGDDLRAIRTCELLVIDDLGTECPTSRSVSQFFSLMEERALHGKAMLITTNLALEDLKSVYSERIYSRITGGYQTVNMYGDDIRAHIDM